MTPTFADPEWGYEPADPSVGIMGEAYFHEADDCAAWTVGVPPAIEPVYVSHRYSGSGANRTIELIQRLTCPCGASTTFTETHYDPEGEDT